MLNYRKIGFKAHGYKCQKCESINKKYLEVHHKDGNRKNNAPENLEVLCMKCHTAFYTEKKKRTSYNDRIVCHPIGLQIKQIEWLDKNKQFKIHKFFRHKLDEYINKRKNG